jgi:single-strand DNA-binding protein
VATRSLNKVLLIGNLTRDPELRYTPQGTAVVTFGLATNRTWVTESGERREDTQFHRIVAWNKLAELCQQLLVKGRRVFVEGRLSTRRFVGADGQDRQITEIVIDDMLLLDSRRVGPEESSEEFPETTPPVVETPAAAEPEVPAEEPATPPTLPTPPVVKPRRAAVKKSETTPDTGMNAEDIPF